MASDANTVNIESRGVARATYHHGALREDLVECGMRLLEQRHSDDLSLREVAREAGVSATAVYRHFSDKTALLRAIAERGYELMAEMQEQAAREATGGAAFAAVGAAYVRFALRSPAVFRLMFASAPPFDLFARPIEELSGPLRVLRSHVAALTPPGMSDQARAIISIRAWSLVHGLAVLALSGMVAVDEAMIAGVIGGTSGEFC
jgi:AcrR family transcriptional regulator